MDRSMARYSEKMHLTEMTYQFLKVNSGHFASCEICFINQDTYSAVSMVQRLNLDRENVVETLKNVYHWLLHQPQYLAGGYLYKLSNRDYLFSTL